MHFYIPWWSLALLPLATGFGVVALMPAPRDYDFMTPMVGLGVVLIGFALSLGLFIGHWL